MQTPEFYEPNFVLNCFCVKLGYHQQTYLSGTDKSFLSPGKMVQGIGMVKDFVNFIITIKRLQDDTLKQLLKSMTEVKNELNKLQNLINNLSDLVVEQAVCVHLILLSKANWSKHQI